jgi:hypothetical protein
LIDNDIAGHFSLQPGDQAGALGGRNMNEDIGAAVVRLDDSPNPSSP